MIPTRIIHHKVEFDLQHLQQRYQNLQWKCQDKRTINFKVRIRFSDHCISEEIFDTPQKGAMYFTQYGKTRIFNPDRYQWSLQLPTIIDSLFAKPTESLRLTTERNWFIVQLSMQHPLRNGERYYCFLRFRNLAKISDNPLKHYIHLQVESAYPRSTYPLTPRGNERIMFGRLLERLTSRKI
jgi:hypothetical protein